RERSGTPSSESQSDRFPRVNPHTGDGRGATERPLYPHAGRHASALMNASVSNGTRTFLMYAQDGKGMGHITRTTTIAKHLLAANPNWVAYITTESPVIGEFGLRDIMDDVTRIRAQWRDLDVYDALENLYDGIAVYGSPDLYDVAEAYAIPPSVRPKLHYCGYVVRDVECTDSDEIRARYRVPP